ncbi:hypothetical protein SUDANB121_05870 (plasmid) [Nocardiopsis dassonvillei]|uniref:hypothetical protein n=1 Tax=Nocardiopsis dassonvillei TaxID=2014 RepID=UPI003F5429F6
MIYTPEQLRRLSDAELAAEETAAARALEGTLAEVAAVAGPDPEGLHVVDRARLRLAQVRAERHMLAPALGREGPIRPWPPGQRRLHLYLLPDPEHEGLAGLPTRVGRVLQAHTDLLTPVPHRWLHTTVGRLEDATEPETEALAGVLGPSIAYRTRSGPVRMAARLVLTDHGLLLTEADPCSAIPDGRSHPQDTGRAWSWSFERDRCGIDPGRAHQPALDGGWHLTLAHCHTAGSGRRLAADLAAASVPLDMVVDVVFTAAVLAWVTQHPGPAYTWETANRWALPPGPGQG